MYKNRLLQLVAVVVMLMVVAASGVATNLAYADGDEIERPFRASVTGTVDGPEMDGTAVLNGVVNATHMGRGPYEGLVSEIVINPDGTGSDVLVETLTATNGDTLIISCKQTIETLPDGRLHGTDEWEVIGGTGRFSGASGSGSGDTYVDLVAHTVTKELTGVISY